jgi:pantothenate kinase type III
MLDVWNSLCAMAIAYGKIDVPKSTENPLESGIFHRSVGKIRGQIRDYRASVEGATFGIHAVEFLDRYEVHVDRFDPYKKPLEHLIVDSPDTLMKIPILIKILR